MSTARSTNRLVLPSMTRVSDLADEPFDVVPVPKGEWENGQYVVVEIAGDEGNRSYNIELAGGRLAEIAPGDQLVAALGRRAATLQCVGDWESVESIDEMDLLSIAGVAGRCLSQSAFVAPLAPLTYVGHVQRDGHRVNVADFAADHAPRPLSLPTVLIIGTSMDAGKTTAAVRIIRTLVARGLRVAGVKFTGMGRYRDVLAMRDAGAEWILDFVDGGIPSTVVPPDEFRAVATTLLARIDDLEADVVVLEAGASPLEPYNGDVAVELLGEAVRAIVLCASDPYAAVGVLQAFGVEPTLVAGRATCTDAGTSLTATLTGCPALNLLDPSDWPQLEQMLEERLDLPPRTTEAPPESPANAVRHPKEPI